MEKSGLVTSQQKVLSALLGFCEGDKKLSRLFKTFRSLLSRKTVRHESIFSQTISQTNCKNVKDCQQGNLCPMYNLISINCEFRMNTPPIRASCCRFGSCLLNLRILPRGILAHLSDGSGYNWVRNDKKLKYLSESLINHVSRHTFLTENEDEIMLAHSENWILKRINVRYPENISLWPISINEWSQSEIDDLPVLCKAAKRYF
jgi:hypothetical protein